VLPIGNEKTNHFKVPIQVRYVQYKQGGTYYHFPKLEVVNNDLIATFYKNMGNAKVKLTKKELIKIWRENSLSRARQFQQLINENGWSRAQLARHLGVSRSWVTQVMRALTQAWSI
jgi:predicted XRE-type DNA-binding protein